MQRSVGRPTSRISNRRQTGGSTSFKLRLSQKTARAMLLLAIAVVGVVLIGWLWQRPWQSSIAEQVEPAFEASSLEQAWLDIIRQYERVSVGIEAWDVQTNTRASVNSLETFRAASVTKMITAAYAMSQVEAGSVGLPEKLADQTALYWHLEQMVRWSSNESWSKIRDRLGRDAEQQYAASLGLASYDLPDNTISTDDMARFMVKLAQGKLISQNNVNVLESYMTDTYEERFLPAGSPAEAVVYHKAGTLEDDVHEAAIIDYKGKTYVLVIMTNGNGITAFDIRANLFKELAEAFYQALDRPVPTAHP